MRYIAHRGLFQGPNVNLENTTQQTELAIRNGYEAEVDVWVQGNEIFLGHYYPLRKVDLSWLLDKPLWIHCKNVEALEYFNSIPQSLNYFWHEDDKYTLTSYRYIWAHPKSVFTTTSVMVMPEHVDHTLDLAVNTNCLGICSDYVETIKQRRNEV